MEFAKHFFFQAGIFSSLKHFPYGKVSELLSFTSNRNFLTALNCHLTYVCCAEVRRHFTIPVSNIQFVFTGQLVKSINFADIQMLINVLLFLVSQQPYSKLVRLTADVSRSHIPIHTHAHTHTQSVGLLWTGDQPVREAATCTTNNKHNRPTSMPSAG